MSQQDEISDWDGPIKYISKGKHKGKVLLPLGRTSAGFWPVLKTAFSAAGWQKIKELCDWEIMRQERVTFLICPYQLVDKSEVWCLHQPIDFEGHEANNREAEAKRSQRGGYSPRRDETSPGAFDVMD